MFKKVNKPLIIKKAALPCGCLIDIHLKDSESWVTETEIITCYSKNNYILICPKCSKVIGITNIDENFI